MRSSYAAVTRIQTRAGKDAMNMRGACGRYNALISLASALPTRGRRKKRRRGGERRGEERTAAAAAAAGLHTHNTMSIFAAEPPQLLPRVMDEKRRRIRHRTLVAVCATKPLRASSIAHVEAETASSTTTATTTTPSAS